MKKRTYILAIVMMAFVLQVTSCTSTSVLAPIVEFVDREDVKDWDNKTLEEKRGVLLRAKVESPDIFIEYIDAEIEKIDEKIRIRDLPPEPTPTPKPPKDDGIPIGGGTNSFLWKPNSESNTNLVVLLPGKLHGRTKGVMTISGSFGTESANLRGEDKNGGRPHFYFSKPGASYGRNITVKAPLTDGTIYERQIDNGSQRVEP